MYRVISYVTLNNIQRENKMVPEMTKMVWSILVLVLVVMVGLWVFRLVKKEIPT